MTRPDFLIIGAMKAGTTTLQDQLALQDGIFMTTPKEPNYFSDDAIFAKGPDWYAALYAECPPGALRGEASTHYTKLPTYPDTIARLQAAVPDPRLIYVIRDPVARVVSHYIHGWSQKEITCDFDTAFDRHPEMLDYSCYAMQIRPYIDTFGSERVYLTSLEQIKADPQAALEGIARFIGHEKPVAWQETQQAQNVSADRYKDLPLSGLLVHNPVARILRQTLVPKALREKVRQARSYKGRPTPTAARLAQMHALFAQDRSELAPLFPDHPALKLCYPFTS